MFFVNNGVPWHVIVLVTRVYEIIQVLAPKTRPFSGRENGPRKRARTSHFVGFEEERGCFGASGSIRDPSFRAQKMGSFLGLVLIKK